MKTVWKFGLRITDQQEIEIPFPHRFLKARWEDRGGAQLWAEVDPDGPKVTRQIVIHGTGHPVEETSLEYLDTVFDDHLGLVWHIWAKPRATA